MKNMVKYVYSVEPIKYTSDIYELVDNALIDFGVLPNIKGYQYICEAIVMMVHHGEGILEDPGKIYSEIAKKYGITSIQVTAAISETKENCWKCGRSKLKGCFPYNYLSPSNIDFINCIYVWIQDALDVSAIDFDI